jgi:formate C-acetyltransferase
MLSPRIRKLLENYYSAKPEIFAERAVLVTRSYEETEGIPVEIRRAKMLEKILNQITVKIRDHELIVGCKTPEILGSPLYPEIACDWIEKELDSIGKRREASFFVSEETKKILREEKVFEYWRGRQVYNRIMEALPDEIKTTIDEGLLFHYYLNRSIGHITVNYERVLKEGLNGIKEKIKENLNKIDFEHEGSLKKLYLLNAMLIVCDAAINFARRYADEARRLASLEKGLRKAELEKIAEICEHVPANPARTFYEALQSFWFIHLILNLETNSYAISPGRFDQYMYPYYKRDLVEGRLTEDEAKELLECLWIKFNELTVAKEGGTAKASTTYNDFQNLNLGGLTKDGEDAVNELSYLCLEVTGELKLPQPQVTVLISNKTPEDFLIKACEVIRMGFGMPSLVNFDELTLSMLDKGVTLEDAWRYGCVNGCVEPCVQGKEDMASGGYINLAKCLELALNSGVNPITGRQIGPKTEDPRNFTKFDDLIEAFKKQLQHAINLKVVYDNIARQVYAEFCPVPFTSMLIDDCIERGRDYHDGGAHYNIPLACGVGIGTVANSLAAIKKLVFEEKTINMATLVEALAKNFEGYEQLRQVLINKAPKYGNDDEYTDYLAREVLDLFCAMLKKHHNRYGVPYTANIIPTTTHIYFGDLTGATPDGRRAREPLSEGASPVQGTDTNGPTAVIKSVAKLNHAKCSGVLLNMKFHPMALNGEDRLRKFAKLIRTFFELGGHHVQFNVVSAETLRDAQKHPEKYRDLIVRVAGYSDYFVRLSKELQDEIISRTEHGL